MKLIDRYLLRKLSVPLSFCLLAFIMISVVHDLFDHLDDFIQDGTPLSEILLYYSRLVPSVLALIVPIALLLAVLYSLSQLTKNNELTAMRASGVSLYRLLIPFVLVGLGFTAGMYYVNERIAPDNAYWCDQYMRAIKSHETVDVDIVKNHPLKNEMGRRNWMITEFNVVTFEMRGVNLIQEREDSSYEIEYDAKAASWLDGKWWFRDVTIQVYDESSNPRGRPRERPFMEIVGLNETPKDFINEVKYDPRYMTASELLNFVRTRPNLTERTVARYLTDYHYRLALPWTCVVATLLGIPVGSHTGRKGAFLGVLLAVSLLFVYYVAISFFIHLGKSGVIPPGVAGWLPNFIFLAFGLVSLYRMR
jgi:lipopolysaccharide export system permease protein